MDLVPVKNIFAAVFDKSCLDPLLAAISRGKVRFWGTEGTTSYLSKKGFDANSVVKDFDFDGRVKSLDRVNFARILADKSKKSHLGELKKLNVEAFDLVVVDLYAPDPKIFPESMDIGGQSLIRSAIKNYVNVALAYDQMSIFDLCSELRKSNGATSLEFRKKQASNGIKYIAERCTLEASMFS